MNNLKVKEIELMDLSDETLMKIVKFSPYDCDKVIFKYNSDILEEDINKKILYLSGIQYELTKLIYDENNDLKYDENKHNNIWIETDVAEDGIITSVTCNLYEISEAIKILGVNSGWDGIDSILINMTEEIIPKKFNDIFIFRNSDMTVHGENIIHKRYFNHKYHTSRNGIFKW